MKVGDTVPVNIANDVVAQAKIVEVDREKNQATMIVPATRVVMALKVELDTTPTQSEPEKEVIITGVDRVDGDGNVVSSESAPVVPKSENDETPSGDAISGSTEDAGTPEGTATQTELKEPAKADGAE